MSSEVREVSLPSKLSSSRTAALTGKSRASVLVVCLVLLLAVQGQGRSARTVFPDGARSAERAEDLIWEFAPAGLRHVILKRTPLYVTIAGKELNLQLRQARPNYLEGRSDSFTLSIDYDYLAPYKALRWGISVRNEGDHPIENLLIVPLAMPMAVDPETDVPRVRHISGSNHFDAAYPPHAFRVSEERFMTHDHAKNVRIGSSATASAYEHVPVLQFAVGAYGQMTGLIVGFEWSSLWSLEAGWSRYSFTGEPRPEFQITGTVGLNTIRLEPGESLKLPGIHMVFWEGPDWRAADNALRNYVREVLSARFHGEAPTPPVTYDHWFGIYQFYDVENLKRQATRAAELGCECFYLGPYYPIKNNLMDGLGNWYADPKKFPRGIEELSQHVRSLGMGFGVWHWIERATPGSKIVREHPDVFYKETFLRLDLPEGRKVALDYIRKWIKDWKLSCITWELSGYEQYPPPLWTYELDPSGKLNLAFINGRYEIMDTIRQENPDVYIESVSGGATSLDWGMAVRSHGTWLNDHTADADVIRFFQTGASRFWPVHFLNSAVRVNRNSGDLEATPHNLLSRMVGTMSFEGDIAQWSPEATALARKYVDVYKEIRDLLAKPIFFPLPQPRSDRDWDAVIFGEEGGRRLLFAFRMEGPASVTIEAPQDPWRQLLGSEKAQLRSQGDGVMLRLEKNSSALWELDPTKQ